MKGSKLYQGIIVIFALGLVSGCTALDQDARINFLEGQMKDTLQKSAEWDVTSKNVRTRIADFGAQMDSMREEMQRITGTIEELQPRSGSRENPIFSQQGVAEEVRALRERLQYLEARVTELEKGMPLGKSSTLTLPPTVGPSVTSKPPIETTKTMPPVTTTTSLPKDQAAYNQAMEEMKQKQYDKAIRSYRSFIKKFPESDLKDNAQYWIGECYYALKKYEEAIIEFEEVIQQYPKGDKVAAALLKEGLAFHELKDNTPARQILKKLIDQYPNSEEAQKATEKLKEF